MSTLTFNVGSITKAVDVLDVAATWAANEGLRILITLVVAVIARAFVHRVITRFVTSVVASSGRRERPTGAFAGRVLATATGLDGARQEQRARTVGSLLNSVATFVIGLIAGLTILGILHIPLGPLLASAGVGGIALGFGAQSLVKDFMSGIFMILEDQYGVGDIIDTGQAIGTVEEVTLRITRLKDLNGVTWYVRNGEIMRIGNHSQGASAAVVDIPFSDNEDVGRVIEVIREVATDMKADEHWSTILLDVPAVLGVESVVAGSTTVRVLASCASGSKWDVQREVRRRVKEAFAREGVEGPEYRAFPNDAS